MALRSGLGLTNRLVRRVQRHRSVATLFRSVAPVTAAAAPIPPAVAAAERGAQPSAPALPAAAPTHIGVVDPAALPGIRVRAELVSPAGPPVSIVEPAPVQSTSAGPTPEGAPRLAHRLAAGAVPPAQATDTPVAPPPPAPTRAPLPAQPQGDRLRPAAASPAQVTREDARPTAPSGTPEQRNAPAPSEAEEETTLTDQVWRRLQTIFQRHRERSRQDAGAPPAASGTAEAPDAGATAILEAPEPIEETKAAGSTVVEPPGVVEDRRREPPTTQQTQRRETETQDASDRQAETAAATEISELPGAEALTDAAPSDATTARTPLTRSPQGGEDERLIVQDRSESRLTSSLAEPIVPSRPVERPTGHARDEVRIQPTVAPRSGIETPPTEAAPPDSVRGPAETPARLATEGSVGSSPGSIPTTSAPQEGEALPTRSPAHPIESVPADDPSRSGTIPAPEAVRGPQAPAVRRARLEDVWQVERIARPEARDTEGGAASATRPPDPQAETGGEGAQPTPGAQSFAPRAAPPSAGPRTAETRSASAATAVLEQVAAARPTASSIETLPPRRPRPRARLQVRPRLRPPSGDTPAAAPGSPDPASLPVDRTPSPDVSATQGAPPASELGVIPVATPPGADGPEREARPTDQAAPGTMVPTEIGPLPSDLWSLIGERPPVPARSDATGDRHPAPPADTSSSGPAAVSSTIQRSVASGVAQAPTPAPRRADLTAQAPAAALTAAPGSGSEEQVQAADTEETASAADIEKLAQRVYAELRRRLMVEWERLRRT